MTLPPPWWTWPLALPAGLLYRALVLLRLGLYRRGWLRAVPSPVPVIAVGNLTVGGAGKTPLVRALVRLAVDAGLRPAVQSRGYGRRTRADLQRVRLGDGSPADPVAIGDEPAMLALAEPDTPVYIGARRVAAVRLAWAWERPDVIVADDAYQHLRLGRAGNVLLIDAERGLGNGRMAPWGPLREPASQWRRADVIVLTKANLGDADALEQQLRQRWGVTVPILRCDHVAAGLERLDGAARLPPSAVAGREVALISGIAQPRGFERLLASLGARVGTHLAGADHQVYDGDALAGVEALLDEAVGGDVLVVTTAKDAVKLRGRVAHPDRLWVLALEARLSPEARAYFFALLGKFG